MARISPEQYNIQVDEGNDSHHIQTSVQTLNGLSIRSPASMKPCSLTRTNAKLLSKLELKNKNSASTDISTLESNSVGHVRQIGNPPEDLGCGRLSRFCIPQIPSSPKKKSLSQKVPTCKGDSTSMIQPIVSQEIPEISSYLTSGIKIENEIYSQTNPAKCSGENFEKFIHSAFIEADQSLKIPKAHPQIMSSNPQQGQTGTNFALDTNIDLEEILKNHPEFNQYYEEKMARLKQQAMIAERRTALHAAIGMTYAAKVSRSDLRSFEKF